MVFWDAANCRRDITSSISYQKESRLVLPSRLHALYGDQKQAYILFEVIQGAQGDISPGE
jgi:hypothetical protein